MGSLLSVFALILFGLGIGRGIRIYTIKGYMPAWVPVAKVLRVLTFTVLLGLMPIVLIGAFWNVDFSQTEFLILPVIGVFTIFLGGGLALVASKIHGLTREQTGSMFLAGAFINLGSFGALFSVFFYRD
ncbi:hypothetical protein [Geomicrobium sp. JCM 19055]|uniref:hypothetical protein n=1 Tax=Geomicrobium sp. JCM 19055 TaxID=1460649 RepID=UPI00045ED2E0|nr:hypothetical protein [Geomicrobium sp. JCM 19055]GAJ97452.1 hypothetical protein JCM19055_312 [Geomicrobium sp. JCM 19055]